MPKSSKTRQTTRQLIREKINELHKRGSGDYESLIRQVDQHYRPIRYNLAQMGAELALDRMDPRPNEKGNTPGKSLFLEWGRGTGKSTKIGGHLRKLAYRMPRSTGMMIGSTYQQILTRTLPSIIQGLEQQGIFKDLHFFVGRQPPKKWKWYHAFQPPESWKRYISFWNGMGCHLISQDVPGDGRALNADWLVGDEAALLDKQKLDENTTPALRGSNKREFSGCDLFVSQLYCSTTPLTQKGRWFVDQQQQAEMHPDHIKFIRADARHNRQNLADTYLEDAKRTTLPMIYDAEYLNIRPNVVRDGFYGLLDEDLHSYNEFNYSHYHKLGQKVDCRGDEDCRDSKTLILCVDWGASINCAVACQHIGREFRALKNFYVLGDDQKFQDDLFDEFHDYYNYHTSKTVYLWYDHTGNVATGVTKRTRAERAKKQLESKGWKVKLMTRGKRNPQYADKYLLWGLILQEKDPRFPLFRVNKSNCRELWVAMGNARIKQTSAGEIKKDKSSEKRKSIERQYATDLTDAIDAGVFGMFERLLRDRGGLLPESSIHSM